MRKITEKRIERLARDLRAMEKALVEARGETGNARQRRELGLAIWGVANATIALNRATRKGQ